MASDRASESDDEEDGRCIPTPRTADHLGSANGGAVALHQGSPLQSLRQGLGLSRSEVADSLGEGRGTVSMLEELASFEGMAVGVLRRYVAALGASLELVVRLPTGSRVIVVPARPPPQDGAPEATSAPSKRTSSHE